MKRIKIRLGELSQEVALIKLFSPKRNFKKSFKFEISLVSGHLMFCRQHFRQKNQRVRYF